MTIWSSWEKICTESKRLAHYLQLRGGGVDLVVPPLENSLNIEQPSIGILQVRSQQTIDCRAFYLSIVEKLFVVCGLQ